MTDLQIKEAELDVKVKSREFDRALGHLHETIEDGSDKVTHVVDLAKAPKRIAMRAIERGKIIARRSGDLLPIVVQDRRFQVGAASIVGGFLLGMLFLRRSPSETPVGYVEIVTSESVIRGGPTREYSTPGEGVLTSVGPDIDTATD